MRQKTDRPADTLKKTGQDLRAHLRSRKAPGLSSWQPAPGYLLRARVWEWIGKHQGVILWAILLSQAAAIIFFGWGGGDYLCTGYTCP